MDKKILLIEDLYEEGFTSGTKARQDVRKIIDGDIFYCYIKKKSKIMDYAYSLFRLAVSFPMLYARSRILIQYPFYANERFNKICYRVLPKKAVLLIHDISSLRYEMPEKAVQREIGMINQFRTKEEQTSKPKKENCEESGEYTIAFAGNLGKSRFLDQLIDSENGSALRFALYGIQPSEKIQKSGFYKGVESPDRLPNVLEGDFGLVWDGESLEEGQEAAGRYLRYNCPHKFSLYMAAGMPVIVGKQSAMAEITERETLGITVGSLRELPGKLAELSAEDYREMQENAQRIKERVRQGKYLEDALKKCGLEEE